jgi:hypothetical protein
MAAMTRWTAILLVALTGLAGAEPAISPGDAATVLYGDTHPPAVCAKQPDPVECMIDARYAADPEAQPIAVKLYRDTGDVPGLGVAELMDGGYRGKIHLVPELPIARYRKKLVWVAAAMASIDTFFTKQFAHHPAPAYRWRAFALRFVRSVHKRTPSAYALIAAGGLWTVEINVSGSLLGSETGVRETLFHELFHPNDGDHHDWSAKTLGTDYAAIVKKCGTRKTCLAPYAPNDTVVRGGTYYAFQPNNGATVHEYAAELAVRYFKEQTQMLDRGKLTRPAFKCGPPENARAWQAIVDEFFAGVDRVPAC